MVPDKLIIAEIVDVHYVDNERSGLVFEYNGHRQVVFFGVRSEAEEVVGKRAVIRGLLKDADNGMLMFPVYRGLAD